MADETQLPVREERIVDENLTILYQLQSVDSQIDAIVRLRGELPLEVQDLEDDIEGKKTRAANTEAEIAARQEQITNKRHELKSIEMLVSKYTEQQKNVRNNREYDAFAKELEFQRLEIELRNKQIRDLKQQIESLNQLLDSVQKEIAERMLDLGVKRSELDSINEETQAEEARLQKESEALAVQLPDRILAAYLRVRANARNGLAVVPIERGSCGGCFNRIPPQRQLDIRMRKRIIVCEYCGRIIVSPPEEVGGEE